MNYKQKIIILLVIIMSLVAVGCTKNQLTSNDQQVITQVDIPEMMIKGEETKFSVEVANTKESKLDYTWALKGNTNIGSFGNNTTATPTFKALQPGQGTITVRVRTDDKKIFSSRRIKVLSKKFKSTYGGYGNDGFHAILATSDGGYLAAGYDSAFTKQAYAVKGDQAGLKDWAIEVGNKRYPDRFTAVEDIVNLLGDEYLLVGYEGVGNGTYDGYVRKVDESGEVVNEYIGFVSDRVFFRSAVVTETEDYLVVVGNDGSSQSAKGYVAKVNLESGERINKKIPVTGYDYINLRSVVETKKENYLVVGYVGNSGSDANMKGVVFKLDSNLEIKDKKYFGTTAQTKLYTIEQVKDNNYVLAGTDENKGYLVKIDADLAKVFGKQYSTSTATVLRDVNWDENNNKYVLAGTKGSVGTIIKVHADGAIDWSYQADSTKSVYAKRFDAVAIAEDGNYFAAGYAQNNEFGDGDQDAYVLKLDSSGEIMNRK
ncbi:hypothetical protein Halha_1612 [Halobacteroides halobius DSM 5150]|uniref:PKD domain protein n=1 Tax=Halobacteroides halobius (strain ATCC 35273 / DSM 5150 / MD-1) TaxID=748449 RepID=L0KAH7_HALHC|nr:hypothetical protein [Halobacteroides halobius]AGB41550.1 hypothetical protein Halha_1612 [Halobacteroides halobius DSM 5150]